MGRGARERCLHSLPLTFLVEGIATLRLQVRAVLPGEADLWGWIDVELCGEVLPWVCLELGAGTGVVGRGPCGSWRAAGGVVVCEWAAGGWGDAQGEVATSSVPHKGGGTTLQEIEAGGWCRLVPAQNAAHLFLRDCSSLRPLRRLYD